jgi:hypothetical protein
MHNKDPQRGEAYEGLNETPNKPFNLEIRGFVVLSFDSQLY